MIPFRLSQPPLDGRHHVETNRASLVDIDCSRVSQQEDWLAFLVLPSGPHNVVDVDLMSNIVDVLDLISVEGDLRVP